MNRFSLNPLFSKLFILSVVLTLGWIIFMRYEVKPLTTDEIVRFEFAGTIEHAIEILEEWETRSLTQLAIHSIYLDFVFIFLYTSLLALGCLTFPALTGKINLMNWGLKLYRFSLYAGFADFLENLCLMELLYGARSSFLTIASFGLAFLKFSIVVAVLLFLFRCIIQWAIVKSRN